MAVFVCGCTCVHVSESARLYHCSNICKKKVLRTKHSRLFSTLGGQNQSCVAFLTSQSPNVPERPPISRHLGRYEDVKICVRAWLCSV